MIYKLVVISDIHHNSRALRGILPIINSSDYLIFCGDGMNDVRAISGEITVPTVCVRGNNDWDSNIAEMGTFVLGDTRVLVTHGHRQDVRHGIKLLHATAKAKNCSLVFFGHTHTFYDVVYDSVHYINPGALRSNTYAMVVGDGKTFTCRRGIYQDD